MGYNERTELTLGARYTEEEKVGRIEIPYIHSAAAAFGFAAPPVITGLEFEDDNLSPEVALNYYINEDISVYISYKEGSNLVVLIIAHYQQHQLILYLQHLKVLARLFMNQKKLRVLNLESKQIFWMVICV